MAGPVTLNANTRGYDALMQTLIGIRTARAADFDAHVRNRVRAEQAAGATRPAAANGSTR